MRMMNPAHRTFRSPAIALAIGLTLAASTASAQAPAAPPAAPRPPAAPAAPAKPPAPPGAPAPGAPKPAADAPPPAGPVPLSDTLTGMAKAEYEAGRILYQDGDFASALVKFERAFELSKEGRLLWNIAVCEKQLRRYSKVLRTLTEYLQLGPDQLTDQDRADAAQLEAAVKAFVSRVTITVNEPGADVLVDDVRVGTSPLAEPVLVDVGERKIRVSKPGYTPFEKTLPIADDITVAADIAIEVHQGTVVVEAGPSDDIFIDGKRVGRRRWEGVLPSGPHRLRVSAVNMLAHESEVVVQDGQTRRIPVTLQPASGGGINPWFIVLGGGVLLAAGAVTAGVLLTQPDDAATTPGTIQPGTIQLDWGGFR